MPSYCLFAAPTGKRAVLWCLLLFLGGQLVLGMYLRRRHPELPDPVYGSRFRQLQERLAEQPGRPLVLILGSSRA